MAESNNPEIINVTEDGGITKKILRKGVGFQRPPIGSQVNVHYVGKLLDGTVFDSSRDRGEEFSFKLGVGQVIKGWDEGVKTMLKGELALLTCKPQYAYGKSGSPPKIPADATLEFEVELFSWISQQDVSEHKDKGVLKTVVQEGEGYETPKVETKCVVNLRGKILPPNYDEETIASTQFESYNGLEITIGEDQVCVGLENCITSMKKGEKARVNIVPRYAFGEAGKPEVNVPPNSSIQYEVELVDMKKIKESWEMSSAEKLEAAELRKVAANELFKQGKVDRAIKKYKRGIIYLEADYGMNDEEKVKAKATRALLHNNIAACCIKNKDWNEVKTQCTKVIEYEPGNVKAYLRRGKAHLEQDEWSKSRSDLEKVLELDPNNQDAKSELARLKKRVSEHDSKEKKAFGGMFEKMAKMAEKETKGKEPATQ